MKIALMFASLALSQALLMADPEPASAPALSSTNAPAGAEDLAEHAALVQRLGAEAARGFDAETHARNLRLQIEQLVSAPMGETHSAPKAAALTHTLPPMLSAPHRAAAEDKPRPVLPPTNDSAQRAVQQAVEKVHRALNELEAKLEADAASRDSNR